MLSHIWGGWKNTCQALKSNKSTLFIIQNNDDNNKNNKKLNLII